MDQKPTVTRRGFLGGGLGTAGAAEARGSRGASADRGAGAEGRQAVQPLAQDFTIACRRPTPNHFIHDPGMALPPNGDLLAAAPAWSLDGGQRQLLLARSSDGGRTWGALPSMLIDGDDLVILSRTSRDAANQHDADLATFHRVRDFRPLAAPIWPQL